MRVFDVVVAIAVAGLCILGGCARHRPIVSGWDVERQQLESRIEDLSRENERLRIQSRSAKHRVAEAEKLLARTLGYVSDEAEVQPSVIDPVEGTGVSRPPERETTRVPQSSNSPSSRWRPR